MDAFVIADGGGIDGICGACCLMGSSNSGAGNTGLGCGLPVPDGPPPPMRFLVGNFAPVADNMACPPESFCCSTNICCCRAKTSHPLVTYPACISCFVNVSSDAPISCK